MGEEKEEGEEKRVVRKRMTGRSNVVTPHSDSGTSVHPEETQG